MLRLNYLDPYVVYRTRPPVLMPESQGRVRKGQAYIVLAPSIEKEMEYLSSDHVMTYRYLENYFLEKRWDVTLYGQGHRILKPNEDGDVTALLNRHRYGALRKTQMQQFLPTVKTSPLRGFNTLIEVNHVVETILNNPKDRRMLGVKMNAILAELIRAINVNYIGDYEKTLVIPVDRWLKSSDYKTPEQLFKPKPSNPLGIILNRLTNTTFRQSLGVNRIVLQSGFYVLILDNENPPKSRDNPERIVKELMLRFLRRSKGTAQDRSISDDIWDPDEVDAEDDAGETQLRLAEEKTEKELRAETVMDSMKIDQEKISPDTRKKMETQIDRAVEAKVAPKKSAVTVAAEQPVTVTKDPTTIKQGTTAKSVKTPDVKVQMKNTDEPHTEPSDSKLADLKVSTLDTPIGAIQNDVILKAQMEGRSVAQEKRNELLRQKYNDLNFGSKPLKDIIEEEKAIEIPTTPVAAHTINENFKDIKAAKFEKVYDESVAQHDLVSILMHFASADPAMYLNKNIEIEDVSTRTDRVIRYGVEFEDSNRKRHRFHFKLPKMYKHKYLFLNGQEMQITHQKLPFPITKVQPDRCQLVTNYNKIFVYRYGTALSPRMIKLKKILSGTTIPGVKVRRGDCIKLHNGELTTIEYDELSGNFVRIDIGSHGNSISFIFDPAIYNANGFEGLEPPKKVEMNYNPNANPDRPYPDGEMAEDDSLIPLAIEKLSSPNKVLNRYWASGKTNLVYSQSGFAHGELSDFLIN